MAALLDALVVEVGLPLTERLSSLFVEEETVRVCVLVAGTGIFEGPENVSLVRGCSKILFNDAPFPPLEPFALMLVIGSSTGFAARTGEVIPFDLLFSFARRSDGLFCCVIPVPAVRLVRFEPVSEDEGRDFAKELAVGAKSVDEERFTPVLPATRPVPVLPLLLLTLLIRLLAVPSVLVTPRSSDSCFF